ncbi:MAG: hypothetical protein V8Q76_14730 [Bacteroides intestinalis]|jgi:hypothetical protein
MDNEFMLPVSVEEFAAFLDGNLSQEHMNKVETIIATDDAMHDIALNCQAIDDSMTNSESIELMLPDELSSLDFELPIIEDNYFDDNNFDYPEVAACAAEPIDDTTDAEGTDVDSPINEDLDVLNHPGFSEDATENIDNHLTNQDGVENLDTLEFNDL